MQRPVQLAVLALAALLLLAPAVGTCGEVEVTARCPMADEMGASGCSHDGQATMDCCDLQPAPEPAPGAALETAKRPTALEITGAGVGVFHGAVARWHVATEADAAGPGDRGRYTLHSAFLL